MKDDAGLVDKHDGPRRSARVERPDLERVRQPLDRKEPRKAIRTCNLAQLGGRPPTGTGDEQIHVSVPFLAATGGGPGMEQEYVDIPPPQRIQDPDDARDRERDGSSRGTRLVAARPYRANCK